MGSSGGQLGTSALHMAAMYGHYEVAEVLLAAGISRDARTKVDKSPLHLAATEGFTDIVELLLMNHAEVNCRDMVSGTEWDSCCNSGGWVGGGGGAQQRTDIGE